MGEVPFPLPWRRPMGRRPWCGREMGPAPSGSVFQAAAEEAMAARLCLRAVLCYLWLCLSRTTALRCQLVQLTQLGPNPSPSPSPSPSLSPGSGLAVHNCEEDEVCHQTLLRVRTGPVVAFFLSKGCTVAGPQSTGVSQYRRPPEVSLTLYNHVCSTDLCNDDQTLASLWNTSASPRNFSSRTLEPAGAWCQACASLQSCPEDAPFIPCPPRTHCYRGALRLMTGNLSLPLAIWGCASWANCSLLNGLWTPGPVALREICEDEGEMRDAWGGWTGRDSAVSPDPGLAWKVRLGLLLALRGACLPQP